MLQFIRRLLSSKIGAAIGVLFVVLLGLLFAAGDVGDMFSNRSGIGGGTVATVGGETIDTASLSQAATTAMERIRQDNPRMSMKGFLASGGLDRVLDEMIDRAAVSAFGKRHGLLASDRLIDSEIAKIPAFMGPDGSFSEDAYRQAIQQRGISDKLVREDLSQGLIAKQVLMPASLAATPPRELAKRYAALLRDRRSGAMAVLPSVLFAPDKPPSEKALAAYYAKNTDRFIRPERRVIRYASFGAEALKDMPKPTEAEIAFRYKEDKAKYEAQERRSFTQLIVPTQAAAKAVIAEVEGGASLEAAARAKGLETARVGGQSREALASQFSQAVANAVFAAEKGKLGAPARSDLGWHVTRIDGVDTRPARPIDQVRGEIAAQIAAEKHRVALTELLTRIEDQFDQGGNLTDAAGELGVGLTSTGPVTADGQVYDKAGERIPPVLNRVLETAFSMEEQQPQIAEVEPGKTFVIYDVADITPSAPAPLTEIHDDVVAAYVVDKGFAAARKAAEKVRADVARGASLQQALASLKKQLPPAQDLHMTREELARMQQQSQQRVPPPIALFFSMAEGTVKILAAPEDRGWFVVSLEEIEPGVVKDDDPILSVAQRELAQVVGNEYADALRRAIRADVGVKRNQGAIDAVRKQLDGGS